MLKKIKEKNEELISNYFQQAFGGLYKIECDWGFPRVVVTINWGEDQGSPSSCKISTDTLTDDYTIHTMSTIKNEDGSISPNWTSVDNKIIDFVVKQTSLVSESLFTAKMILESEAAEAAKEAEEAEVVEDNPSDEDQKHDDIES